MLIAEGVTSASKTNAEVFEWIQNQAWSKPEEINKMYKDYSFIILALVIVWLLLPIKYLLSCCKGGEEMTEDNVTYQDRLPFFTDDYDT